VIVGHPTQYIDVVAKSFTSVGNMLDLKNKSTVGNQAQENSKTSHRLLLALGLLLFALAVVVVTDRQFWFGSNPLILDSDGTEPAVAPAAKAVPSAITHPVIPAPAKNHLPVAAAQKTPRAPVVTAKRTLLPPLAVEVVAGDTSRTIRPASDASANITATTNAAGREPLSTEVQPQASYPLLAQHMDVQGSVVLQAVIGADGIVESLRVLRGPAILSVAAQQAVREWRFKPVVQNGQAVETKALITVNFTINVGDGTAKATLAENRYEGIRIISR
jgi:protein TonB